MVTFGGAYAVLAYVAQQAVQFVAFLGAYRTPGSLDPWAAAVLASLLVAWLTCAQVHGAAARQPVAVGGADRHHHRPRGRDRQPRRGAALGLVAGLAGLPIG